MAALHDMHCHLDFIANGTDVAAEAARAGTLLFANTVTPDGWTAAREAFGSFANVIVGFGLHPWWVGGAGDAERACALLEEHDPTAIGEIGLDLGRRHAETAAFQRDAFTRILAWAANRGGKLISIHSMHAAAEALDAVESSGAAESCSCIFHWFTGPSDQLKRAVDLGCYFSFGTRALATGKGREYVKAVPANRLLLETDFPPQQGQSCSYTELRDELSRVAEAIAAIKGEEALATMAATTTRLMHLAG